MSSIYEAWLFCHQYTSFYMISYLYSYSFVLPSVVLWWIQIFLKFLKMLDSKKIAIFVFTLTQRNLIQLIFHLLFQFSNKLQFMYWQTWFNKVENFSKINMGKIHLNIKRPPANFKGCLKQEPPRSPVHYSNLNFRWQFFYLSLEYVFDNKMPVLGTVFLHFCMIFTFQPKTVRFQCLKCRLCMEFRSHTGIDQNCHLNFNSKYCAQSPLISNGYWFYDPPSHWINWWSLVNKAQHRAQRG